MITIEHLSVFFGRTVALDDIELQLDDGVVGIFGPNGSGKSTLIRAAAGLLRPSRGTIRLDGQEVAAADEEFRGRVGYAGHETGLYPRLTLEENLHLFATLYGLGEKRVEETLRAVGLVDRAAARVDELSAGMKRRAAVARALLHEPQLLLLDEPYANVDDEGCDHITSAIECWKAPGRTAMIATHGAKRLKRYADGGVILKRGRLVVAGSYHRVEAAHE